MQKHLLSAVAAAAIVAIALPSTVSAQDTTRARVDTARAKIDSTLPKAVAPGQTQQTSTGDVAVKPELSALLAALDGTASATAKVSALSDVPADRVRVVDVQEIAQGSDAAVSAALEKNKADVDALRAALDANASIRSALGTTNLTSADVIAADVGVDGTVTLFTQKK